MKKLHSLVSTSTILVKDFKNNLLHTRHERLHEVTWNGPPGGEQSLAESIHTLKLRSILKPPMPSFPRGSRKGSSSVNTVDAPLCDKYAFM